MKTAFLLLLGWCLIINSFPLVTPTKNKGRFNIRFPKTAWDDFPAELFSYKIFIGPVVSILSIEDTVDLCKDFKDPKNYTLSCKSYFCSQNEAYYDEQSKNSNITLPERIENILLHIKMERYCTLCNQTFSQNFTKETCPNDNRTYPLICDKGRNPCPSWSICVPFHLMEFSLERPYEPAIPVCYDFSDDTFNAKIDFTHKFLYWVYYRYTPIIGLIGQIILFITISVCLVIPEIALIFNLIFCSKRMIFKPTWKEKFFMIFTLRNIGVFILFLVIIMNIIALSIDICGFFVFRLSSLAIYPSGGATILCYFINVIIWQYILEQSRKSFQKIPTYSLNIK